MTTTAVPVQTRKYRRWTPEQKMAVLQEWRNGTPLEELCRRHAVAEGIVYRWRRSLERGLTEKGELVPKSQVVALQKRVEELEKAFGRKALENEVLKKAFELKGLRLPEGI